MQFSASHLIGNEPIKSYLTKAVQSGQLHHTLLFSGRDGIGKRLFAKALAQALLDAPLQRVESENHPDLHVLRPEGKSGTHPIEQLRLMIDEIRKPPFEATRKVFIICDAERMLPPSANALLKTLEEPDLDCQIVLVSSSPSEMLPTILSRCVHLSFQPIPRDAIMRYLQEKHSVDPKRAQSLARLSIGSIGHALTLLANDRSEKAEEILFDTLEKKLSAMQAIEQIDGLFYDLEGVEFHQTAQHLLAAYLMWERDQELKRSGGDEQLLYFPHTNQVQPASLIQALERAATAKLALERNVKFSACLDFLLSSR